MDAPRAIRAVRRADDEPTRGATRRCTVQVFRRLDRPGRQRRAAAQQAPAAAGRRAQRRRHHVGVGRRKALHPRPDRFGSALSDGQCLRQALRFARVQHRHLPDPRSEDAHRHDLQGSGARSGYAGGARTRTRRGRQTAAVVGLLGQREDSGTPRPTITTA